MLTTTYVAWTDPDTGQRQLRTFAGGAGSGRLIRSLRRQGVPYESGAAASAGHATTPHTNRPWRADPRVGRPKETDA